MDTHPRLMVLNNLITQFHNERSIHPDLAYRRIHSVGVKWIAKPDKTERLELIALVDPSTSTEELERLPKTYKEQPVFYVIEDRPEYCTSG